MGRDESAAPTPTRSGYPPSPYALLDPRLAPSGSSHQRSNVQTFKRSDVPDPSPRTFPFWISPLPHLRKNLPFLFIHLRGTHSSTLFFSSDSALLAKNTRGGGRGSSGISKEEL